MIALTFDDGPHPQYAQLLKFLDHYSIPASFFWLGTCVNRSPAIKTVYERGHWIGLHGYDHRSFPHLHLLTSSKACKQQAAIAQACCVHPMNATSDLPMVCLHPNLGFVIPVAVSACDVGVVPEDWVRPGVSVVVQRVLQQVQNGSLIVLHDGACGGQDVAATTAAGSQLLQQGYQFAAVTPMAAWICISR